MPIEAGATYVFDLGYYDYGWWADLHEAGCRIVTRFKTNTPLTVAEERPVVIRKGQAGGTRDRARCLDAGRDGDWPDQRRQIGQRRQRDFGRGRAMIRGQLREDRIGLETTPTVRTAEWAVGQQRDAMGEAVLDDSTQDAAVVPQAQLDLHRSDVGDPAGFLNLPDGDVAQPHCLDQAAPHQRVQGADAGGQRHAWIRRVKLVERNPLEAQRTQARLAR